MPQYEFENLGPDRLTGRGRGRTPEEAARRALSLPDTADLAVDEEADLQGWQTVRLGGEAVGRLRLHQRMQFRRD